MSDRNSQLSATSQRIVGLTGGVGMGKTTVSNYLASVFHFPVLDADIYAREAVQPGSQVLNQIVERYGSRILLPNGSLDRVRLGEIVFNNSAERLWLEQQIHPYVRDRFEAELSRLSHLDCPIIVVVAPLLFEARMTDLVTEIWVVYCPISQQIERLIHRQAESGEYLDLEQIHARINSQMAIEKKIDQADLVLDNSTNVEALLEQIIAAVNQPQRMSEKGSF
jgi:dephospho-CoA kinase